MKKKMNLTIQIPDKKKETFLSPMKNTGNTPQYPNYNVRRRMVTPECIKKKLDRFFKNN